MNVAKLNNPWYKNWMKPEWGYNSDKEWVMLNRDEWSASLAARLTGQQARRGWLKSNIVKRKRKEKPFVPKPSEPGELAKWKRERK